MVRIAHIADVHIRGLSRHDEYQEVFDDFYQKVVKLKVDRVFVGGDIFHTKTTGISPEYIDVLTAWLKKLSSVVNVDLVLGNHDGNLMNLSRQDAITPIVNALRLPNVKLYKASGTYELIPGFNLCVMGIFDEKNYANAKPIPGAVNIASYHGSVVGSKSETDWAIDRGLEVSYFNDYDFVLLGDIHKTQHLAHRNGKPWMSYPGSMIQQNYAESIVHGFLLWDIKSRDDFDVEFVELVNPQPFISINWRGTSEETIDEIVKLALPAKTRYRIVSEQQLTQRDVHTITTVLSQKLCASEVTFKHNKTFGKASSEIVSAREQLRLSDADSVVGLLKKHTQYDLLDELDQQLVNQYVTSYVGAVTASSEPRMKSWRIRRLKFDNTFAYGAGNVINFDQLTGIVGIFGPNRSGKSSIVGSLMYALYNATDRGPMKNIHVVNARKQEASTLAVVSVDGVDYVIERKTTKTETKKGVVLAPTTLGLYMIEKTQSGDNVIDLCGEQRSDTEKSVRAIIGTPEDFLMTSLSAQDEVKAFISQGSTRRHAMLSRFIGLDVLDKLHEASKLDVNAAKTALKNAQLRDWDAVSTLLNQKLGACNVELEQLATERTKLSDELDAARAELYKHESSSEFHRASKQHSIDSLTDSIKQSDDKLTDTGTRLDEIKKKIEQLNAMIDAFNVPMLNAQVELIRNLAERIKSQKQLYNTNTSELEKSRRQLKILDDIPCNNTFPSCKFIKEANDAGTNISDAEDRLRKIDAELTEMQREIDIYDINKITSSLTRANECSQQRDKYVLEQDDVIASINVEIERNTKLKTSLSELLLEQNQRVSDDVLMRINSLRGVIASLNGLIEGIDAKRMTLATDIGRFKSAHETLDAEKVAYETALHKLKAHEFISHAFSRKGIPLEIMKAQLPIINAEISHILHGIVDYDVQMEFDDDSDSLEIYIDYGDSRRIIELGSGMEKVIASLAIRVALINVSSLPKTDMFIIDESFGALDPSAVEACNRLLESLKKYFRTVIVITHVEGVKDAADIVIDVSKNETDAHVHYE